MEATARAKIKSGQIIGHSINRLRRTPLRSGPTESGRRLIKTNLPSWALIVNYSLLPPPSPDKGSLGLWSIWDKMARNLLLPSKGWYYATFVNEYSGRCAPGTRWNLETPIETQKKTTKNHWIRLKVWCMKLTWSRGCVVSHRYAVLVS